MFSKIIRYIAITILLRGSTAQTETRKVTGVETNYVPTETSGVRQLTSQHVEISVEVTFDDFAPDISWILEDTCSGSSKVLAEGGPYSQDLARETVSAFNITTSDGSFKFTMKDEFGDGLCCKHGEGGYTLTYKREAEIKTFVSQFLEPDELGENLEFGSQDYCDSPKNIATYNSDLGVPGCGFVDLSGTCTTAGTGLLDCAKESGELNGSNTLDKCMDGSKKGVCEQDESVQDITITSSLGKLSAGNPARVSATVFSFGDGSEDQVDFFHTTNPGPDAKWKYISSVKPSTGGQIVVESDEFPIESHKMQAVRVNMRWTGGDLVGNSSCAEGQYDDVDDLLFAVDLAGTCPPPTTEPGKVSPHPSEERRNELTKQYGFLMLDNESFTSEYEVERGKNHVALNSGLVVSYIADDFSTGGDWSNPAAVGDFRFKGVDVMSAYEANVICASKCSTISECSFFVILRYSSSEPAEHSTDGLTTSIDKGVESTGATGLTTAFSCHFYNKDGPKTMAKAEFSPYMDPKDLGMLTISTVYRNQANVEAVLLPEFVGCDVPVGPNLTPAILKYFGCVQSGFGMGCADYVTPEFGKTDLAKYVLPGVFCIYGAGYNVTACLECITGSDDVGCQGVHTYCEKDTDKNIFSAKPCKDGETPEKNGCLCRNSCGDDCPLSCLSELQTAMLCVAGAKYQTVNSNRYGGCINADITELGDVLKKNYSCDRN